MARTAILSHEKSEFADALQRLKYDTFPTQKVESFIPYERFHADMQCAIIGNTAFVLQSCAVLKSAFASNHPVILCGRNISGVYPKNVVLNALIIGKTLIGKPDSLAPELLQFCERNGYERIRVKQGYTKCSCAAVGNRGVITADRGIYRSITDHNKTVSSEHEIDTLLIEPGHIRLDGAEYGFIGGASGYDEASETIYFCGDIAKHPDHRKIREFCHAHNTTIVCLENEALCDIGGILFC